MSARATSLETHEPGTSPIAPRPVAKRSDGLMSEREITTPTLLSVGVRSAEASAILSGNRHVRTFTPSPRGAPVQAAPMGSAPMGSAASAAMGVAMGGAAMRSAPMGTPMGSAAMGTAMNSAPMGTAMGSAATGSAAMANGLPEGVHGPESANALPSSEDDQSSVFRFAPVTIQPVKERHKAPRFEHENWLLSASARGRLASDAGTDPTQLSLGSHPSIHVEAGKSPAARRSMLQQRDRTRILLVAFAALVVGAFAAWFAFGRTSAAPYTPRAGTTVENREDGRNPENRLSAGSLTRARSPVLATEALLALEHSDGADQPSSSEPATEKKRKRKKRIRPAGSAAKPGSPTSGEEASSPATEDPKKESPSRSAPIFKWGEG